MRGLPSEWASGLKLDQFAGRVLSEVLLENRNAGTRWIIHCSHVGNVVYLMDSMRETGLRVGSMPYDLPGSRSKFSRGELDVVVMDMMHRSDHIDLPSWSQAGRIKVALTFQATWKCIETITSTVYQRHPVQHVSLNDAHRMSRIAVERINGPEALPFGNPGWVRDVAQGSRVSWFLCGG